jgi:hypothetical protein
VARAPGYPLRGGELWADEPPYVPTRASRVDPYCSNRSTVALNSGSACAWATTIGLTRLGLNQGVGEGRLAGDTNAEPPSVPTSHRYSDAAHGSDSFDAVVGKG